MNEKTNTVRCDNELCVTCALAFELPLEEAPKPTGLVQYLVTIVSTDTSYEIYWQEKKRPRHGSGAVASRQSGWIAEARGLDGAWLLDVSTIWFTTAAPEYLHRAVRKLPDYDPRKSVKLEPIRRNMK